MQKISDRAFNDLFMRRELKKKHFKDLSLNQRNYIYKNDREYYDKLAKNEDSVETLNIKKFMKMSFNELNDLYKEDPDLYEMLNDELSMITNGKAEFINHSQKLGSKFNQKGIKSYYRGYIEEFKEDLLVAKYQPLFELIVDEMLNKNNEILRGMKQEAFITSLKVNFSNKLRERGRFEEANEIISKMDL